MISKRENIILNLWGLAVGVLFWPLHILGFWTIILVTLIPVLPWMVWKIHKSVKQDPVVRVNDQENDMRKMRRGR